MELNSRFSEVFGNTPILGMIHLAGDRPVQRAIEELHTYQDKGIDGAIIENYHSLPKVVVETLKATQKENLDIVLGINVLPNEFQESLPLATKYGADFVQLDFISGKYESRGELDVQAYEKVKAENPNVIVLGGVWPKYYTPLEDSNLEEDLKQGMERAEAIVVTGSGTGMPTPLDKIKRFKKTIGNHPLIVGAGLTPENAYEQLLIADGAIVGSCFKKNNHTMNRLDEERIDDFMNVLRQVRKKKSSKQSLLSRIFH